MIVPLPSIFPPGASGPASPKIFLGSSPIEAVEVYGSLSLVKVNTSRKGPAVATIELTCYRDEAGRWPVIDNGYFVRWKPIRLEVDFDAFSQHLLSGYILKLTPEFPEDRSEAKLTVEIQDETAVLDRQEKERVWPGDGSDQPVSDVLIIQTVSADYVQGLSVSPFSAEGQTSQTLNQTKTDYAFLLERAEASAFEFRIVDGEIYFGPPQLADTPQPALLVYAGGDSNTISFKVEDSADAPEAANVASTDVASGEATNNRLVPDLPLLGDVAVETGDGVPSYELRVSPQGDLPEASLRALAQGQINEASLSIKAECEIDGTLYGHVLLPGHLVEVGGVGNRYGGAWYVDSVEHELDDLGYRQKAVLLRNGVGREVS